MAFIVESSIPQCKDMAFIVESSIAKMNGSAIVVFKLPLSPS
ncbi:hypothetical protein CCACVL1_17842 [Corchorus capsularis]|uniref:Uncharacterized protein n=1 Tax=Corchorus capsularis TaxID=210143 RepID=A0A1R3HPL4_COCAP|nr:hypothetical protein CCACVL1_17842 [Corchorus capsularis]